MEIAAARRDHPDMAKPKQVTPQFKGERPRFFFREWRKHRGHTQEELSELVGISAAAISQIETGKQGFTDTTLLSFSHALHCTPGDLLMRNPLDTDAPWSIWDTVQRAAPAKKREIVAVVETLLRTGTGG